MSEMDLLGMGFLGDVLEEMHRDVLVLYWKCYLC